MGILRWYKSAAVVAAALHHVSADDVPFMTELELYSQLAPCAQSAVIYNYNNQMETTACGPDVTKLQSCICSQTVSLRDLQNSISSDVTVTCGTVGTDDLTSVTKLISKYCTPDADITFSTPTTNVVNNKPTDVPEFEYLPPCAQSGVSEAVYSNADYPCPTVDNMYAPCVCSKKGVVDGITKDLSRIVRSTCSNGEDVTLASNFFTNYCNMLNGTTSFQTPPAPPGDMSYYITALTQFKELEECAQSGMTYAVLAQSNLYCPAGPQGFASCVCLKSGLLREVSRVLTSSIKFECGNTANKDVSSAGDVLDYYCSAARDEVTASVVESVAETYPTQVPNTSRPTKTGGASETGGAGGDGGKDGQDGEDNKGGGGGGGGGVSRAAVIAASVLGAVVLIAIVVGIALYVRRKNKKKAAAASVLAGAAPGNYNGHGNHSELQGENKVELSAGASPSPYSELPNKSPPPPAMQQYGYQQPQADPYGQQQHGELQAHNNLAPNQATSPSEMSSPTYGYGQSGPPLATSPNSAYTQGNAAWGQHAHSYELDSNQRH